MTNIYQVIQNEYMAYEYDNSRALFITLDINEAIEKAKEFFSDNSFGNSFRPDFMTVTNDLENVISSTENNIQYPKNKTNPHSYSNQFFVIETEIGVDLRQTRNSKKVVWSPSENDIFLNFSKELKELFLFDLNISIEEEEISELWTAYKKDPKVINGTIHYSNPVNSAYILQLLNSHKQDEELYELEINTK
jgi:hypothetical protein